MIKVILALAAMAVAIPAMAQGVYHPGYVTQRGTYVAPHYQSPPNGTTMDNYGTQGNVNPYTGQLGTTSPYQNNDNSGSIFGR